MNKLIFITTVFVGLFSASAELIVDGDFSGGTRHNPTQADTNHGGIFDIDNGWVSKGAWSDASGAAVKTSNNFAADHSIHQITSVGSATGSKLTLSFDWQAGTTSTNTPSEDLRYYLVGFQGVGTANGGTGDVAGDEIIRFINSNALGLGQLDGTAGTATKINLITGASYGTGTANAEWSTFAGTAGSTLTETVNIDLSGYGANFDDISDYDYFALRLQANSNVVPDKNNDLTLDGATIDNVSLVVAIPEPSSLVLLGVGLVGLIRRRLR